MKKPETRKTLFLSALLPGILAILLAAPAVAAPALSAESARASPSGLTPLSSFIEAALSHNQDLALADAELSAAQERIPQAGALEDPKLSIGTQTNSWFSGDGLQKTRLGVSQSFPWFGTLAKREEVEEKLSGEKESLRDQTRISVVYEVSKAYYEYAFRVRARKVAQENTELLRFLEGVAQSRYASGTGSYSDLLRIQVELDRARDEAKSAEDSIAPAAARVNALMNLPPESPLPPPGPVPVISPELSEREILSGIREQNPRLAALKSLEAAREGQVDLARKAFYPNFTAEVAYQSPDRSNPAMVIGRDEVLAGLGVSIPLWREKRKAGLSEARQKEISVRAGREALLRSLEKQAAEAAFSFRDAARKLSLYEQSLIPKAQQSLSVTLTAYTNGAAGVADLVEAQKTLLSLNLMHCRALADQAEGFAMLEFLYGGPIACTFHPSRLFSSRPGAAGGPGGKIQEKETEREQQ